MNFDEKILKTVIEIAISAGKVIMDIYEDPESDFSVEKKADNSPLTIADKKAHEIIDRKLREAFPNIPVMSEEGVDIPYEKRCEWESYWCVDPLDGTKEFIKKNGEFTVNIALIKSHFPVMGVIYIPVKDRLYFTSSDGSPCRCDTASELNNPLDSAEKINAGRTGKNIRVMVSRSHISEDTCRYIEVLSEDYDDVSMISAGSSMKFCLIAEGSADVYPRFGPTMEWDTAAGQAIVSAAGKKVIIRDSDKSLTYNKKNLRNPHFIVR